MKQLLSKRSKRPCIIGVVLFLIVLIGSGILMFMVLHSKKQGKTRIFNSSLISRIGKFIDHKKIYLNFETLRIFIYLITKRENVVLHATTIQDHFMIKEKSISILCKKRFALQKKLLNTFVQIADMKKNQPLFFVYQKKTSFYMI